MKRAGLPLFGMILWAAAAGAQDAPPVDLNKYVDRLEAGRETGHEALRQGGAANTRPNHLKVDQRYIEGARLGEAIRETALDQISMKANVGEIRQGPYGTDPRQGRGVAGDIDTRNYSKVDQGKIATAARKMGYTVTTQGDAVTIKELGTTVHSSESPYKSPLGSSARDVEMARGYGKETSLGYNKVTENLTKGSHTLNKPVSKMTNPDFQELAKMTGRNMEYTGTKDPSLENACKMLKGGASPDAAIVPDGATGAQRMEALKNFQKQCEVSNLKALGNANQQATVTENNLRHGVESNGKLYQQAKATAPPNSPAVQQARAQFEASKAQLIEHQAQQAGAKETFIKNQPNAVEVLNQAGNKSIQKVVASDGSVYYRDLQTGKRYSPSQVKELALGDSRKNLADTVRSQPEGKQPVTGKSVGFTIAKYGLLLYSGYQGQEKALDDLIRDGSIVTDSTPKLVAQATLKTVWYASGIPGAIETGRQAGDEAMDEYYKKAEQGEDPSWLWAKTKGMSTGVFKLCKGMTWDVGYAAGTAIKQGKGAWFDDPQMVEQAEAGLKASEVMLAQKKAMQQATKWLDQKMAELDAADDDEPDPIEQEMKQTLGKLIAEMEQHIAEEEKTKMVIGEDGVQFVEAPQADGPKAWADMTGKEKSEALVKGEQGAWQGHLDGIIKAQKQTVPAGLGAEPDMPDVAGEAAGASLGDEYDQKHLASQQQKTAAAASLSSAQQQITAASTAGDQSAEAAKAAVSAAGSDAALTQKSAVTEITQADQQASWGSVGKDIVQDAVQTAAGSAAGAFGAGAAQAVTTQIFPPEPAPAPTADGSADQTLPTGGAAVQTGAAGGGAGDCAALKNRIVRLNREVTSKAEQAVKGALGSMVGVGGGGNVSAGDLEAKANELFRLQDEYVRKCGPLDSSMQTPGQLEGARKTQATQGQQAGPVASSGQPVVAAEPPQCAGLKSKLARLEKSCTDLLKQLKETDCERNAELCRDLQTKADQLHNEWSRVAREFIDAPCGGAPVWGYCYEAWGR